jgi:hypothetical protein
VTRPTFDTPYAAYLYARDVDCGPRDDTRAAACGDPATACAYALCVDEGPRDDTRAAACRAANTAYLYALYVDCGPRDDTWRAARNHPYYAYDYAYDVLKRSPVRLGRVAGHAVFCLAGVVKADCQYRTIEDWAENWRVVAAAQRLVNVDPADVEALLEAARAAAGKEDAP